MLLCLLTSWKPELLSPCIWPHMLGVHLTPPYFQPFSVQFSHSVVSDSLRPHEPQHARPPCPSPTLGVRPNPCPLIELVMSSNHLILCGPLLLLPSIFPSIKVISNESALRVRCPKFWSFNFNISPSNEHPGLISFRMDWLDLLAVQGTLKSLLQYHSSNASILRCSAFFVVQLSHPYMTTGKTIALTRLTFVDKVMSLLFNMLSRLVITFLPMSYFVFTIWWWKVSSRKLKRLYRGKWYNAGGEQSSHAEKFQDIYVDVCS